MTKGERQTLATFVAAVLMPVVLFASLQAASSMRAQRQVIEARALSRAQEINTAVDARLMVDQAALEVLSSSQFLVDHDWSGAKRRFEGVQSTRSRWRNVILTDAVSGQEIWETRSPAQPRPARPWIVQYLHGGAHVPRITGVVGGAPDRPCVALHVPVFEAGQRRYLLTLELNVDEFQAIVLAKTLPGTVTALVDHNGLFIGRSLKFADKLGKPATPFVREAIARGPGGLYRGVTYEGLKNFTAYESSSLTGWSTHVAMKEDPLIGASRGAVLLVSIAGLAALALAVVIALFGFRQFQLRRREEARSAQSQKLAAVGQLASGIAHDFNNLLMVIGENLRRIAERSDDPALARPIDNALAATVRGETLIQQLMAFTRSQPLDIGRVDLAELLASFRELLQQSVGKAVSLVIEVDPDARLVTSNAGQLEMALVNLAVNARDAMPKGGMLTLRAQVCRAHPSCIDLDVIDTGEGMSKEVIERAMEPFFTTKPLGKGTGLGLAQVFGVVSQSGGAVEIHSEPGAGTTIKLRLKRWTE
jgi:signal transduction histidine kinase